MSSGWGDFTGPSEQDKPKVRGEFKRETEFETIEGDKEADEGTSCDWGFSRQDKQHGVTTTDNGTDGDDIDVSDSSKIIPIYERYIQNKESLSHKTKNYSMFCNNPQKAIREWFDNEGHEFDVTIEQPRENQFICSLDLPIDDHDFALTSETHDKKQGAMDEVCLIACKMLDECELLFSWQFGSSNKEDFDKKRRLNDANKEDDIELDNTEKNNKRLCSNQTVSSSSSSDDIKQKSVPKVNTYESLMNKWNELNMSILQSKADLVKIDLSVSKQTSSIGQTNDDDNDEEEEIDPLDAYMSSLETKTKLTMDEKIEKTRLKSQIAAYEREQNEVSRLIKLAKPKFDLNKACPARNAKAK